MDLEEKKGLFSPLIGGFSMSIFPCFSSLSLNSKEIRENGKNKWAVYADKRGWTKAGNEKKKIPRPGLLMNFFLFYQWVLLPCNKIMEMAQEMPLM